MAWTATEGSKIFRAYVADNASGVAPFDLDAPSDVYKVALYNSVGTPDRDATSALSAYAAATSAWVVANEKSSGADWPVAGQALAGMTITPIAGGIVMFDATDRASGGAATLSDVHGCLTYNDTKITPVADQGVVFNYFGGANGVTGGTLTVVWHVNGVFRITV